MKKEITRRIKWFGKFQSFESAKIFFKEWIISLKNIIYEACKEKK